MPLGCFTLFVNLSHLGNCLEEKDIPDETLKKNWEFQKWMVNASHYRECSCTRCFYRCSGLPQGCGLWHGGSWVLVLALVFIQCMLLFLVELSKAVIKPGILWPSVELTNIFCALRRAVCPFSVMNAKKKNFVGEWEGNITKGVVCFLERPDKTCSHS